MKHIVLCIAACVLAAALCAQWSTDPYAPSIIAGFDAEQVIPKVAIVPNGNTYICRFDNQSGGYRVYLDLFDIYGNRIWTESLLISSHTQMSWLTEYDLGVDTEGNAIIVFQDIRNAGVNNVVAYKVNPAGEFLWGADGIALSNDTNADYGNMSPVCFCSADGSSYFAWQRLGAVTSVVINRLSADGQKLWGEWGTTFTATEGSYTWPQIIQSEGNDILLKLFHDTGPFWSPTRHILVMKGTPDGTFPWTVSATEAGGIPAWEQLIPFVGDGAGGAVLAWYDDRDSNLDNDVYCQRIDSQGNATMGLNGSLVNVSLPKQQFYPEVAVDAANQQVYVFYRETDADQNNFGLARQLMSFSGNCLWGQAGPTIVNIGGESCNTIAAHWTTQGAVFLYERGANLYASCWTSSGDFAWASSQVGVAQTTDPKQHFDCDHHPDNWCVLSWEQGYSGFDIYAMRINGNGSLGPQFLPPRNLTAEQQPPSSVILSWQHPSPYVEPDQYCIFMNDELAQTVAGDVLTYTVTDLGSGTHEFYVKARYGDNYSDPSNSVTVTIVAADDPILPSVEAAPRLTPNPFSGTATLSFVGKNSSTACVTLYNAKGQKLGQRDCAVIAGTNEITIDPRSLGLRESGVFFLSLRTGGQVSLLKGLFIK